MRLALISPKGVGMGTNEENKKTAVLYEQLQNIESLRELMSCPNSPLLTIAALAKDFFNEIIYLDEELEPSNFDEPYDMVAMSFMTQQASRAFELAREYQKRGSYLIAGGMHPTNSPEETSQYFNTVFIGEAENTWFNFMEDFKNKRPKQFYNNQDIIDMAEVPMPMYELLPMEKYRTIPIQISRGCPHNCEFCASTKVYGPKYRHKPIESVLKEIDRIKSLKKNPHIYFTDDNMLVNRTFIHDLLDNIRGSEFRWMTHTDVSVAYHDDVLKKLYPSGCRKLVIGFESIVPDSLINLEKWKYKHINFYSEAINKIQAHGIGVWGTFIVGLDGDDLSVFQRVVDFCLENNLFGAMISVPTPFPGSRFYDRLKQDGRILTEHWGNYTLWNVVVKPANMSVEQLEDGFNYVLKQIYSPDAVTKRMEYFKNIYVNLQRKNS